MEACQTCGFPNPEDEEFCRQCGLSLTDPESAMEDEEHAEAREYAINRLSMREKHTFARMDRKNFEPPWSHLEEDAILKYNENFDEFFEGDDYDEVVANDEIEDFDHDGAVASPRGESLYPDYNIIEHIFFTGGIIGLFSSDELQLQRCLDRLNRDGYKIHTMIPAAQGVLGWLVSLLILLVTLFFYTRTPGYIVIGERITVPEPPVSDAAVNP